MSFYLPWIQAQPLGLGQLGAMAYDFKRKKPVFACLPWFPDLQFSATRLELIRHLDAAPYPLPGECGCERYIRSRPESESAGIDRRIRALWADHIGDYFPKTVLHDPIEESMNERFLELNKFLMVSSFHDKLKMIYPAGDVWSELHMTSINGGESSRIPS